MKTEQNLDDIFDKIGRQMTTGPTLDDIFDKIYPRLIANRHWKEGHPKEIFSNMDMDELRRKECLCINCGRKNDNPPYSSCHVAGKIYNEICVPYDMAMMITRCGATDNEGNLMYIKLGNGKTTFEDKYDGPHIVG